MYTYLQIVVDGEVVGEDEEEMKARRERSGEIAKEMSALVNYITPYHFKVSGHCSTRRSTAAACQSGTHAAKQLVGLCG